MKEVFENLSGKSVKRDSPDPKQQQVGKVNLGENLILQAMRVVKAQYKTEEEQEIASLLGKQLFKEYLKLK